MQLLTNSISNKLKQIVKVACYATFLPLLLFVFQNNFGNMQNLSLNLLLEAR